jgi:hypothetical protein
MKLSVFIALPSLLVAQAINASSFNEYAAVTEAAAIKARNCRLEVQSYGVQGQECEDFAEYSRARYQPVLDSFHERIKVEGTGAFDGNSESKINEITEAGRWLDAESLLIFELIR